MSPKLVEEDFLESFKIYQVRFSQLKGSFDIQ